MIETERLWLRKITLEDQEELFELHSDPEVQKYTGEPVLESMEEIVKSIAGRIKDYNEVGFGRLAVIIKATNEFIGWAGLTYLPEFDEVDLGYRFKKEFWGKGFATEASKAILEYGFNELGLEKIVAIAIPEHKASIKVMQKAGMKFYKHAPYEEGSEDAIWYQIDKTAYDKAQRK
ncbi:GNAT family N-acetyltransferase [uncultured Eudoraea sp.]|uniref:GNAT family N-acetyltransferase n=1 Tax=uncultured Eudoraea sp. TaxID=1035614 RepID=UPI0026297DFE|nr:GNAT family N-acetyltransferase [uncultured Eudoraea sp.]